MQGNESKRFIDALVQYLFGGKQNKGSHKINWELNLGQTDNIYPLFTLQGLFFGAIKLFG